MPVHKNKPYICNVYTQHTCTNIQTKHRHIPHMLTHTYEQYRHTMHTQTTYTHMIIHTQTCTYINTHISIHTHHTHIKHKAHREGNVYANTERVRWKTESEGGRSRDRQGKRDRYRRPIERGRETERQRGE